jgi:hypothetical protein
MELSAEQFEIRARWEIPQPPVENSDYARCGRYPWYWHSNAGFAAGYSPEEREKHTLLYMHDRYGLEASYKRFRSSGGSEQASAIKCASTSLSNLTSVGGVSRCFHSKAASSPSSSNRFFNRSIGRMKGQ